MPLLCFHWGAAEPAVMLAQHLPCLLLSGGFLVRLVVPRVPTDVLFLTRASAPLTSLNQGPSVWREAVITMPNRVFAASRQPVDEGRTEDCNFLSCLDHRLQIRSDRLCGWNFLDF